MGELDQYSLELIESFDVMSREVAQLCETFKRDFKPLQSEEAVVEIDNKISKILLSAWVLDILLLLARRNAMRFEELRRSMPGISGKVLSRKLAFLQGKRLVSRRIVDAKPPRVEYRLSREGHIASRLAEPLMIYLRHVESS